MNSRNKLKKNMKTDHDPSFLTFPLSNTAEKDKDSKVSMPSEGDVTQVKEWVDYKEM